MECRSILQIRHVLGEVIVIPTALLDGAVRVGEDSETLSGGASLRVAQVTDVDAAIGVEQATKHHLDTGGRVELGEALADVALSEHKMLDPVPVSTHFEAELVRVQGPGVVGVEVGGDVVVGEIVTQELRVVGHAEGLGLLVLEEGQEITAAAKVHISVEYRLHGADLRV